MDWLKNLFGDPSQASFPKSDSSAEIASELIVMEQMASELDDYLLADQLFRQIVVDTPLGAQRPKMTLGGLYQRIEELESAADIGRNDRTRLRAVRDAWDMARNRFPDQFQEKLNRELVSYLNNWKYFLDQRGGQNPQRWREDYKVEIRNRRRVELIIRLLGPDAPAGLSDDLADMEKGLEAPDS
ncbi:MAG: hypothetical protein J5I90_15150 [Caldilineales bacterium]|nr:hypothetical protein [Caldilineales bacterium]